MVRIQIGDVLIKTDQELTPRQLHSLLGKATTIALMLASGPEEPEKPLINLGFTTEVAHIVEPDLSEYFEDERVILDGP